MGFRFIVDNVENRADRQMYDFTAKKQYSSFVMDQFGNKNQL
jgi:hypothetical protein